MNSDIYFSSTYTQARELFLAACKGTEVATDSYKNARFNGPDNEPLICDVARFGPEDATNVFLSISGTHGLEGFCGSAVQTHWILKAGYKNLPDDVAVIFVHAINPWGFAYHSRTTENNVDLNRNFAVHNQRHPENPIYDELHAYICPQEWNERTLSELLLKMRSLIERHGEKNVTTSITRGQHSHPDGLNYGGNSPEWSNFTIKQIAETHLVKAKHIALIDWHTGLGNYGEPFFLCFNEPEKDLHRRAASWWGEDNVSNTHSDSHFRPDYTGLLFSGVQQYLPNTEIVGGVIEFGTQDRTTMYNALRSDRWIKFEGHRNSTLAADLQRQLRDAFFPTDDNWRVNVLKQSYAIQQRTIAGLADWNSDYLAAAL